MSQRNVSFQSTVAGAEDVVNFLLSGASTVYGVDQLAKFPIGNQLSQTLEITFNKAGQVVRVIKKNVRLSGQTLETLIFPLEVYLDSNVYQYLEGSPEEELISSFQNKYNFDLYKLKYVSSKQLLLPRGAVTLTLDLDEPRTNDLLIKNDFSPDIQVGFE